MSKFTTELRYICETNAHVASKYPNVYLNKPVVVKDGDNKYMVNRIECLCYTPELVHINGFRNERIKFEHDPTEYTITGNSYVIDNVFYIDLVPMIRNNIDEGDQVVFLSKENEEHSVNDIIASAAQFIFNFDYPIFDENYRRPLETKILRHYYTREISEETYGLWKLRLDDRMNMIMPYYNKLYESELIKFNPLYDVDLTRSKTGTKNGSENTKKTSEELTNDIGTKDTETIGTTNASSVSENAGQAVNTNTGSSNYTTSNDTSGTKWDLYSDTPQGGIDGIEGIDVLGNNNTVEKNYYLTNARKNTDDINATETNQSNSSVVNQNDTTSSSTDIDETNSTVNNTENISKTGSKNNNTEGTRDITSIEDYIETVQGKQGTASYSKLLKEFRETFLNIDKMIIDELEDLFFGLWA